MRSPGRQQSTQSHTHAHIYTHPLKFPKLWNNSTHTHKQASGHLTLAPIRTLPRHRLLDGKLSTNFVEAVAHKSWHKRGTSLMTMPYIQMPRLGPGPVVAADGAWGRSLSYLHPYICICVLIYMSIWAVGRQERVTDVLLSTFQLSAIYDHFKWTSLSFMTSMPC